MDIEMVLQKKILLSMMLFILFAFLKPVTVNAEGNNQDECNHVWGEAVVETPATVLQDGVLIEKCFYECGAAKTSVIPKIKEVKLKSYEYKYKGSTIKPAVTVYDSNNKKISADYYTVKYKNNKNPGEATVIITFKDWYSGSFETHFNIIPTTTKILKAEKVSNGIKINWVKNTTGNGYEIYRSTNDSSFIKIATVESAKKTAYRDTTATGNGIKYGYQIRTIKTIDDKIYRSAEINSVSTYFIASSELTLQNTSNGIYLKWNANTNASGYYIYRSDDGKTYKKIKTIEKASTAQYTDTSIDTVGNRYKYKIMTYKEVDDKTYYSAYSPVQACYFLKKPVIKELVNLINGRVTIKWDKQSKINGYQIQYSEDKTFDDYESVLVTDKSSVNKVISGLERGKKYYFRFRLYKTINYDTYYSPWSKVKSIKLKKKDVTDKSDTKVGDTYIEVNLAEQHVYYFKNGKLVLDMDCVSGSDSPKTRTPAGVYKIGYLEKNATLKGEDYETKVSYWMPFRGNDIGFHDASWRWKFGGTIWKTDGSHGCINLSYADAKKLYGMVERGLIVVTYY